MKNEHKTENVYPDAIVSELDRHKKKVYDSDGNRLLRCYCCRRILSLQAFMRLNVNNKLNSGFCLACHYGLLNKR